MTEGAGANDPRWSVSASFVDYDRDGWLDLYVGNYVDPRLEDRIECFNRTGEKDYCGPKRYVPVPDRLLRNRGDGTFADVTADALQGGEYGPALGVVAADLDGDGWQDLYVANDGEPNQLWLNQRDGTFLNGAWLAGVAVNRDGNAEGSMGVDAGDFDADGDDDLFMTHIATETNTLYINDGSGLFEDRTARVGLGPPSLPYTGFGTAWFDVDNDGWQDLLIANGENVGIVQALERLPQHRLGLGEAPQTRQAAADVREHAHVVRPQAPVALQQLQCFVVAPEQPEHGGQLGEGVDMVRVELDGAAEQVLAPAGVRGQVGGRGLLQQKRRAPRFADQRLVERIGVGFVLGQAIGDSNRLPAVLDSTQRCIRVPEQPEGGSEPGRFRGDVLQQDPRTIRVPLHHGEAGEAEGRVRGERRAGGAHRFARFRGSPRLPERKGATPGLGGAVVAPGLEFRFAEPPPGRAEFGGGGGGLS